MSVNAATTVSIPPSFASARRSSRESIPALPQGPPGRSALTARSYVRGDLVLLEGADRPLVLVLRRDQVPDPEDEWDQDRERRVVHEARVEVLVPWQPAGCIRQVEGEDDDDDEDDRQNVDELVAAAQRPRSRLEVVASPEPQIDGNDVREVE